MLMFKDTSSNSISITTGTMVRAVLLFLGLYLIWVLRDLVLVLLTSIVIASFVESAVPHFRKIGIGRVLGIVILYVVCLAIVSSLFWLFAPLLVTEIYSFSTFISSRIPGVDFLEYFQNDAFSGAKDVVAGLSNNFSLASLMAVSKAFINNLSAGFVQTLSVAFGGIFNFMLIVLLSFYFSIQEKGIENFLRIVFPAQYENYVVDLWDRSRRKIALWMKGQMLLAVIVGVLTYLVLSLLGIQYALMLALIAAMMELVPYGVLVALIPAVSFSYLSNGVSGALMVTGAYLIIQQFESFLLAPLVIEKVVGLSPIIIILAVLVGFELGGFWGFILAIPVAVIIMELISDLEKHKLSNRTIHEQSKK